MGPKPKIKGFSLRWGLLGIVVVCWVLPVAVIFASLVYYNTQSVRRQFDETVRVGVSGAAASLRRGVNGAVEASRYASYDRTIRTAYGAYLENESTLFLHSVITPFLQQNYRYDDHFMATVIFFHSNPHEIYYTFNPLLGASYTNVLEYRHDVHDEVLGISCGLDTSVAFTGVNGRIYIIRNIVDSSFTPYASIVSELNREVLLGGFMGILWETGVTIYLNGVAASAAPGMASAADIPLPEDLRLYPGEQAVSETAGGVIHVYGRESTDAVDIRYAVEINMQDFWHGFFNFMNIIYVLLLFTFPLLFLAVWYFYRNIFKPIDGLTSAAGKIQNGYLGYQVKSLAGNREFKYLDEAFNHMSARLKQQFERIYSEELALRDARLLALQSQINPHFLNNTLEIINWEVRLGNNTGVSKLIEALSTMLDAAMDRKSLPLVTLSQEMMYADSYLYIVSERFGKRLAVKKDIDPSLLQYRVPRLIMQPIIENAVEHGVSEKQAGVISISAERAGGKMRLSVYNNAPMSKKDKETVARLLSPDYDSRSEGSLHLGIHNVNMRLIMIYGEGAGLHITSDGMGTTSSFTIPVDFVLPTIDNT